MWRSIATGAALFSVLWGLAGCSGSETPTGQPQPANLTKVVNDLRVMVTLSPNPPKSDANTTVEVTVADTNGGAITDARAVVSLTASAMAMSPVIARADLGDGDRYVATLRPTGHAGKHSLSVDLQWREKLYQAQFDVDVLE